MAEISAKEVMALRGRTGLSMMECKKALVETNGDADAAEELLRKKMKGKMDTRTERAAGEGRIAIAVAPDAKAAAIVELRAETDFTAKNEAFAKLAEKAAQRGLSKPAGTFTADDEITKDVDEIRISTGENVSFARGHKEEANEGERFGVYIHHDGKTGVMVHASGDVDDSTLRSICMHITAADPRPLGVTADDIPADMIEKERKFRTEQAMESGKPKEIAEKMVEGGMQKFFSEVALLEQPFIIDPSKKVKDLLKGAKIISFHRWAVGETA